MASRNSIDRSGSPHPASTNSLAGTAVPKQPASGEAETGLEALTRVLAEADNVPPGMLHTLLKGLPELDLRNLSDAEARCVMDLPVAAWGAIQRHAQDIGAGGVTDVNLGKLWLNTVLPGVKQLSTVQVVRLSAEQANVTIDLRSLEGCSEFANLFVEGDPPEPLTIVIPYGVKAEATGATLAALGKSVVFYSNAYGEVDPNQEPRRLHGLVSDRTTPASNGGVDLAAQRASRGIENNGKVGLVDGARSPTTFVCRHFAMWFLIARRQHHALPDPKPPFSFDPVRSENSTAANLNYEQMERQWDLLYRSGPTVVFKQDQISQALYAGFEGIQPGERRYFAIAINAQPEGHALSLELSSKLVPHGSGYRTEFAVNLYDPNKTATHERFVVDNPSRLLHMDLGNLFNAMDYAELIPFPPLQEGQKNAQKALNPVTAQFRSSIGVDVGAGRGMAAHVKTEACKIYDAPNPGTGMSRLREHLAREFSADRADRASFVEAVLALPPELLNTENKLQIVCGPGTSSLPLPPRQILAAVLAAPEQAITDREKASFATWSKSPQPALHKLCSTGSRGKGVQHGYEEVYDHVLTIANSNLGDQAKKAMITSWYAPLMLSSDSEDEGANQAKATTAAQQALAFRNCGPSAAFVTAILDCSSSTAGKKALLGALGVSVSDVMNLIGSVVLRAEDEDWATTTLQKLADWQETQ